MKKFTWLWMGLCFLLGGLSVAVAQEPTSGPPKVLVIQREMLKPGRSGSLHLKTESAFVQATAAAKWPTHYFGMDSLSGPSRALFFVGYDSFADWEKDNLATQKNASLSAALDRASIADGDLLTSYESSAWVYREDYSLRPAVNIAQMRYMEISRFVVRPGHERDWESLVKLYTTGYEKAVPDAHWTVFENMYGADKSGTYIVLTPMKSLSEVDEGFGNSKKFMATMGEEGMKKAAELAASCIESSATNLFVFNPKMSYVPDSWVKVDPTFWKPMAPAKKAEAKPAQ